MHHVHISTAFMLITALFVLGFAGIIAAFIVSIRRDNQRIATDAAYAAASPARYVGTPDAPRVATPSGYSASPQAAGYAAPQAAGYVAPAMMHSGNDGLLTGMLVGSMMSNHNTAYSAPAPAYVDPAPSYDPGCSYDYAPSSCDVGGCDSGSSSGGFDASW